MKQQYKKVIKKIMPEEIIKKSVYFDNEWYSKTYNVRPENACSHYLNEGYKNGFNPSTKFNGNLYKKANPDIGAMNPLLHYEVYGLFENRNLDVPYQFNININKDKFGAIVNPSLDIFFSTFELLNAKVYSKPKRITKNSKAVLVMSHEMDLTGAPIALLNAVLYLKNNGYTPIIISPNNGFLTKKAEANNIPVIIYKDLFNDNILDIFYPLFDFVFINTLTFSDFIQRLNGTKNQVIWWLHESLASYQALFDKVQMLPDILCSNIHLYAVGNYAKERMLEFKPKYQIENLHYFLPDENIEEKNNFLFGFENENKITFGIVGTLEPRKGYEILLKALDFVSEKILEKIEIVIVGKNTIPSIYKNIKEYKGSAKLVYIEKIERDLMPLFYKKIDCLICPSTDDPMPIVITEAWKNSVPVICSSSTGSSYLIKKYGGGITYDYNDPNELAKAISSFVSKKSNYKDSTKKGLNIYNSYFSENYFKQSFSKIIKIVQTSNSLTQTNSTVSVVIPTYNGLQDLRNLIPKLKSQKDVKLEIVVVDSGSTDGTIEYLKGEKIKLIQISQKEFSHSFARNLGIKNSKGKYVMVMTQDASPSSEYWIIKLLQPLLKGKAVATMCKQSPRQDCDLYGKITIYFNNEFFGINNNDSITSMPLNHDKLSIRKNAQLDDVACMIRKDIFDKYEYRGVYGEDLDLGIRLIEDNYSIARFASVDVIHSHNRKAFYFLKRAIVDSEMNCENDKNEDYDTKIASCLTIYICVLSMQTKIKEIFDLSYDLDSFVNNIHKALGSILDKINSYPITNDWYVLGAKDKELHDFMIALYKSTRTSIYGSLDFIEAYKCVIINQFYEYMQKNNLDIKDITPDEYYSFILKAFANYAGIWLGDFLRRNIAENDIQRMLGTVRI